jgi:hypothetical protein
VVGAQKAAAKAKAKATTKAGGVSEADSTALRAAAPECFHLTAGGKTLEGDTRCDAAAASARGRHWSW